MKPEYENEIAQKRALNIAIKNVKDAANDATERARQLKCVQESLKVIQCHIDALRREFKRDPSLGDLIPAPLWDLITGMGSE